MAKGISLPPIRWAALAGAGFLAAVWVPAALAQGPTGQSTPQPSQAIADAAQASGPVSVLQVRPDVYMLTVGGRNIALQVGRDGSVVVDTGPAGMGQDLVRAIRAVTSEPIRYIIDTSADPESVGNNATVAAAGVQLGASTVGIGVSSTLGFGGGQAALIIAYQNVTNRMLASPPGGVAYSGDALPGEFYDTPQKNFYMNDSAIDVIWETAAHSDGDSVVVFRRDDVVVTGDIFDMARFPVIDLASGGGIQGEIDAMNRLIDTQVTPVTPLDWREGARFGTLVIPASGHLSEQADMVQYRDMLTIIRDRIAYYIKMGDSMQQVVALHPAAGFAPRFGASSGPWTTDDFVAAVYQSLKGGKHNRRTGAPL
jgi:glyoxylase-like metal-dependent hydrolase (beta-lactamase superfamily II)